MGRRVHAVVMLRCWFKAPVLHNPYPTPKTIQVDDERHANSASG
jgi:hypothetical protein